MPIFFLFKKLLLEDDLIHPLSLKLVFYKFSTDKKKNISFLTQKVWDYNVYLKDYMMRINHILHLSDT